MHKRYDVVLATDIDEFLVLDPNTGLKLKEYLSKILFHPLFLLGIDVAQHPTFEKSIDKKKPFCHSVNMLLFQIVTLNQ